MALFSRRKKTDDRPLDDERDANVDTGEDVTSDPAESEAAETVPEVSISVSTFRGHGAPASPAPDPASPDEGSSPGGLPASPRIPLGGGSQTPSEGLPAAAPGARRLGASATATAPQPTETVPGLRDNPLLRQALAEVSDEPLNLEIMNVARQLLQGHVFLRVQGDARTLISEGKQLPLSVATRGDEKFMLLYSSGEALQASLAADRQTDTSAVGQPATSVLNNLLEGEFAGLMIDPASAPARAVLPRSLVERMVAQGDPDMRIKSILAAERTEQTAAEVVAAMLEAPLYVAVRQVEGTPAGEGAADGEKRMGIAELRDAGGRRMLELYSHPLELIVLGRGDQPLPFTAAQLGKALRDHPEMDGVLLDGAGPWIRLTRDDLAPVIAAAED